MVKNGVNLILLRDICIQIHVNAKTATAKIVNAKVVTANPVNKMVFLYTY